MDTCIRPEQNHDNQIFHLNEDGGADIGSITGGGIMGN